MDPSPTHEKPTWEDISRVFSMVATADADARSALLAELCVGNDLLRREVESLLTADQKSPDTFLEETEVADLVEMPRSLEEVGLKAGGVFAEYEILELIAEGGMGSVFRARQVSPAREVALKVLRPGLATLSLHKRFDLEIQVLGSLQHKGIARIHDAGVHDGVPYFVMEYVRGESITSFSRGKPRREQISTILRVCEAVQFAHDRGVVHRDLKPANILVDEFGEPRVLDFGVARITGSGTQAATMMTNPGQLVGTLAYMSPEQASGHPVIDARSDVYALGVILYEVLTGRRPHAIDGCSIPEAVRLLCHEDPTTLSEIDPSLRGDLETIISKAMDKDPDRRYATPTELAQDLRRTLANEPIEARPASTIYQLRKFARRNRTLVVGVVSTIVALAIGISYSVHYALQADEERGRAQLATTTARTHLYRMSLGAAASAFREGRIQEAADALARAPEEFRGFEFDHLASLTDQSIAGMSGRWEIVEWLPDDKSLVLIGTEGLCVWRPLLDELSYPGWTTVQPVSIADVSADGEWIAAGAGNTVHLWSAASPPSKSKQTNWSQDFDQDVAALQISPNGEQLCVAVGSSVHQISLPTNAQSQPSPLRKWGTPRDVTQVEYSPNGRWLGVMSLGSLSLWDLATDQIRFTAALERHSVCAFHPEDDRHPSGGLISVGSNISIGDHADSVRTFALETGEEISRFELANERVRSFAIDPNSQRVIVSGHVNRSIGVFDRQTQRRTGAIDTNLPEANLLAFDSANQVLAIGGKGALSLVYPGDVVGRTLGDHGGSIEGLAWNSTGSLLASSSEGDHPSLLVWAPSASDLATHRVLRGHEHWLYHVSFSPDGRWIASCGWDQTVRVWEVATGDELGSISVDLMKINGAVFSPDSSQIIANRQVCLDLSTGAVATLPRLDGAELWGKDWAATYLSEFSHSKGLTLSNFTVTWPEGFARIIERRQTILFDDRGAAEPVHWQPQPDDPLLFNGLGLSSDTKRIAISTDEGTILVLETASRRILAVLRGHTDRALGVAFSPDGKRIASGGFDRVVRIWDAETYEPLAILEGHTGYVHAVQFSPDGTTLASASEDMTVRLWDTRARQELRTRAHKAREDRARMRPWVEERLAETQDPAAVGAMLRADAELSPALRSAGLAELLHIVTHSAE